jgi:uncharacterized lipoprotein YddW (UPF0748 family)
MNLLFVLAVTAFLMHLQPLLPGGAVAFGAGQDDPAVRISPLAPYLPTLLKTTRVLPNTELRALWVVRDALASPRSVERMIDFAKQARIHLIFLQVRGRGDAYYRSLLVPPGAELEASINEFDPLERTLVLARQAGISVHAWVNVYYVWSNPDKAPPASHVLTQHPEWALSDGAGTPMVERRLQWWQQEGIEGYYISPAIPGVRQHLLDVVAEILSNYSVDGIHLDYVRYPGRDWGLDAAGRTDFALRWGVDPVRLRLERDAIEAGLGTRATSTMDSLYIESRVSAIDSLVIGVRALAGDLPLSAAVMPDPAVARYDKGQDWLRWVHQRWMDFVVPMMYNDRPADARDRIRILHNAVGHDRVLAGLALHDGRHLYLPRLITALREEYTLGYSLFSYNVMADIRFPVRMIDEAFAVPDEAGEGMEGEAPEPATDEETPDEPDGDGGGAQGGGD